MNPKINESQRTFLSEINDITDLDIFDSLAFNPDSPTIKYLMIYSDLWKTLMIFLS